jgi:hypothetical protein
MLIDDLLSNPILRQAGYLTTDLRGRLSKVTKFVLRQDFAIAADEFSSNIDNVNKVLPLARLPFPECWVEVSQHDRHLFAQVPVEPGDGALSRVGFLLTQTSQSGVWSAQMFWSCAPSERMLGQHMPPSTSGQIAIIDPHQADAVSAITLRSADNLDASYRSLIELLRGSSDDSNWIGEPGFLIATLALLNSRNASEAVSTEPNNRQRRRSNRTPLFSYHLVCIPQRYRDRNMAVGDNDDPRQLRGHFCRGHFKVRRTGVFFWSAHQRGDPRRGFVHHDYIAGLPT